MFFCDECRVKKGWPDAMCKSWGKCEVCTEGPQICHDIPSSQLPAPVKLNSVQIIYQVIEEMQQEHADKSEFNSDQEAKVLQGHNFHNALIFLQDRLCRRLGEQ